MRSARCAPRISIPSARSGWRCRMTQGVCAIVGVGTGLGVGGVVANAGTFSVLATEGGHAGFAPTNERAIELLALAAQEIRPRVRRARVERRRPRQRLPGAVRHRRPNKCRSSPPPKSPRARADGSDANCVEAVGPVLRVAGLVRRRSRAHARRLAGRADLRRDAAALRSRRRSSAACASGFEYKGRFTPAMRGMPVETISHPHVELLGAARLLLNS